MSGWVAGCGSDGWDGEGVGVMGGMVRVWT